MEDKKSKNQQEAASQKEGVSGKLQKIIDQISELSVVELADLVKALEEKLGVSAVAPVAAGVAPSAASPGEEAGGETPAQEKTTFNVVLASAGANKISVIKAVRELNQSLGLKEAKDLVESTPKEVLTSVDKKTAEEAKKKLEEVGATVELK